MGLISYWPDDGSFCTDNAWVKEMSIGLLMDTTWVPVDLDPNYRNTDNIKSIEYLVLNFVPPAAPSKISEKLKDYKHILLEYRKFKSGEWKIRYRAVLKFEESFPDHQDYRNWIRHFEKELCMEGFIPEQSPISLNGPATKILSVNKDGNNLKLRSIPASKWW